MANEFIKLGPSKSSQKWLYVILGILIMLCLGTVYAWSVFRLPVENTFGIGSTQSGLPYMVSLAVFALTMIFTGKYLDCYHPRWVLMAGGFIAGMGWFLSGNARNITDLTLTYGVIVGAGVGIAYGVPIAVTAKWFAGKSGAVLGIVLIGFGISPLLTSPLARSLIESQGIFNTFRILGLAFGTAIPILSLPFRYPTTTLQTLEAQGKPKDEILLEADTQTMVRSSNFKGLYISFLIGTTIGLMLIGISNHVGVDLIQLPAKQAAWLISLFAVFNGIGRPTFGWLTDKISIRRTMLISYVLIGTAAVMMLFAEAGNTMLFALAFSIFWFNLGGRLAIAPTATRILFGSSHYSQNYGVVYSAYGIGAIIGVLASGILNDWSQGYTAIFILVLGLCLMGMATSQKWIQTT